MRERDVRSWSQKTGSMSGRMPGGSSLESRERCKVFNSGYEALYVDLSCSYGWLPDCYDMECGTASGIFVRDRSVRSSGPSKDQEEHA